MSIETLLEAAKFVELQAQQQHRAREENELQERRRREQEVERRRAELSAYGQPVLMNHVTWGEESGALPIAVIPIPLVSALSPSPPPRKEAHPSPIEPSQTHPASQHALLPQPSPAPRGSPPDDLRGLDAKKRPGGAGTREVHNKLEKNRRAHLKECFDTLKKNIPNVDEKKTSNLSVLRSALRYIQTLKRKEKDYEHEMERLAREKIALQQRLEELKNQLSQSLDLMEIDRLIRQTVQPDDDQASTSTASEGEDNIDEENEEEDGSATALPTVLAALSRSASSLIPLPHTAPPPIPRLSPVTSQGTSSASARLPNGPTAPPPKATHILATPTVIAHAGSAHASVIQTVKHVTHLAHLPAIYPQPIITHTLAHGQMNGSAPAVPVVGKPAPVGAQMVTHHPQLMGQAVTMVTIPSFPVSTLKLA